MFIVFFYWKDIVHHEFVPRGATVNKEFYLKAMKCLREAVRRKRPEVWTNKTWMLHHDNAPPHASLLIHEFLAKQEMIVVLQPPYSPDLVPADFFLFPKLKSTLKGRRFQTVEEIKENSLQDLRAIPQNTIQGAFQKWKNAGSGVSTVEGSTLKETSLIKLYVQKKKFGIFLDCLCMFVS